MKVFTIVTVLCLCSISRLGAEGNGSSHFPAYMRDGFDYATFTHFDAPLPPKSLIYQSNGFLALQEQGFGAQRVIVPVAGPEAPVNQGERLETLDIETPAFVDESGQRFSFGDKQAKHSVTYFADRTVYRASFDNLLQVSLTVYPAYEKPVGVLRIVVERSPGPVGMTVDTRGLGFQAFPGPEPNVLSYGSAKWPYRLLLAADSHAALPGNSDKTPFGLQNGQFQWKLNAGGAAAILIALGGDEHDAETSLADLRSSPDLLDAETHSLWNQYLAAAPLVAPAKPVRFTVGTLHKDESIAPEELVRSELWFWRGVLNTTCQVRYLPACPMMIADWNVFMGMWSNDGIAETLALIGTKRSYLARSSLLAWFRYAVNAKGDGTLPWTIFPSGKTTFQATGRERSTQGVPVQGSLVGEYVRLTGDTSILNEKPGGVAGDRTVWQALVAYQRNLLSVRDMNHDHLIDWMHTYETGWDDKDSPFIDLNGHPTSAINEQVFNLWSLQEMAYLARIQGEDPSPWEKEFSLAREAVRQRLWDAATERYWDLDVESGKLWTKGENLDAYYLLYFETDPARTEAMLRRLRDPAKFDGALLPTLAFDTPNWGGYWRGPAWPRIFGYVALGLTRSGHGLEGFDWLCRAINSNLGPLLPENVDPKAYPPGEHAIGSVRIMGYDALDTFVFPEVAGLRTWGGEDLTVASNAALGKIFVRNQKWMGDRYDAVFDPGHATVIWRNGKAMRRLAPDKTWRASKRGERVSFEVNQEVNQ
ncbi:MAG: hypothetical protein JO217_02875 [Acidobacteriaceae bacterium]|nr:hypothetical protein [Acidobacteriaceae bacterium]